MIRKINLILSGRAGKIRKNRHFFNAFRPLPFLMGVVCALLVAGGAYEYINMKRAMPEARLMLNEIDELRSEIEDREHQITKFQAKIDNLQLKLIRLNQLDQQIRTGVNLDGYGNRNAGAWQQAGMGGAFLTQTPGQLDMNADDYQVLIDNLAERMELLDQAVVKRSEEFLLLWGAIKEIKQIREATPSILPVQGGKISSGFGYRNSPFTGKREFHSGVDISHRSGAPVCATAAGQVIQAGSNGALGKTVTIDHGFGIITRYAHMSGVAVKVDQQIQQGDVIGNVGSTGRSTGPHLHYEVRVNDIPVDASKFMPEYLASNDPS